MRVVCFTLAAVSSCFFAAGACADNGVTLERRPGLWEMSVEVDGQRHAGAMKQCVDKATDAKMLKMASSGEMQECSKNELSRTSSGYRFEAECAISGSKVISAGEFLGDFDKEYTGKISTVFSPALFGKTRSESNIKARWVGNCPAGMSPGDMILPNGMKMSLDQAQQSAKLATQMMNNPEMAKVMKDAMNNPALKEAMKQLGGAGQ